jgi:hypothetical protein
MPKKTLTKKQIEEIVRLRETGHSLPEIKKITGRAGASVFKYIKGVNVLPEYIDILKSKQGGSKERAKKKWSEAKSSAENILGNFSNRDTIMLLSGLYWGEGSKQEFNLINGDPYLLRAALKGLYALGVSRREIKLNFRIFSDMNKGDMINFWTKFLDVRKDQVGGFEVIEGNGSKKLKYGMCRIRVIKGAPYFKLVMSMIEHIKSHTTLS